MTEERIRCPKCAWEPRPESSWQCRCGHAWNTFDTYGKCPACGKVWKNTQCLDCFRWSPHADWYTDLSGIVIEVGEEVEEIL